jgi:hypothetical protein
LIYYLTQFVQKMTLCFKKKKKQPSLSLNHEIIIRFVVILRYMIIGMQSLAISSYWTHQNITFSYIMVLTPSAPKALKSAWRDVINSCLLGSLYIIICLHYQTENNWIYCNQCGA